MNTTPECEGCAEPISVPESIKDQCYCANCGQPLLCQECEEMQWDCEC